jgi:hypothetical protein
MCASRDGNDMNRLKKICDFAFLAFGACLGLAMGACIAFIIGALITDSLLTASFTDSVRESSKVLFIAFNSIVGSLVLLCGYLSWRAWSRKAQDQSLSVEARQLRDFLARRKFWITALSIVAVLLGKSVADGWVEHHKRFDEADRSATARIVEVDPGEPGSGSGEDADPGRDPSSHYQFQVNGVMYDGWIEDELSEGTEILIRYNSSAPRFNHAQDDDRTFYEDNKGTLILFIVVLAALTGFIWKRKQTEPEPDTW